jgi:hypothetical protein
MRRPVARQAAVAVVADEDGAVEDWRGAGDGMKV